MIPLLSPLVRVFACLVGILTLSFVAMGLAAESPAAGSTDGAARFALPETDEGLPGVGPLRRYDWFRDLWQQRRSEWARTLEQDRGAVVFFGDSITQGWGGGLGAAFPGMKAANRGISGDTTRGLLIRLEDDVLALQPAAVVLLIGTNDLEEGASPETVAHNFGLLLDALRAHEEDLPVIVCEVFPSSASMRRPAEKIQALNHLYRERIEGDPQAYLIDTWELFADENGEAIAAEFPDLLHPNETGYAKWGSALRPVFETLGLLPVDPDFQLEDDFVPLFNGSDLSGWGYRPTSEEDRDSARRWQAADPEGAAIWPFVEEPSDFEGLSRSPDGRFAAINGRLVVTMPAEYRKIQQLWTTRAFTGDFALKLEFRATPNADSGVYLRGPQLQCRDYALAGPYWNLTSYRPQGWNELVVTVTDGLARVECNGETLEEALPLPPTGPIGLEGDRGQMEYRRIRIKEL